MDPTIQTISRQTEVPVPQVPRHKTPRIYLALFVLLVVGSFFAGTLYQGISKTKEVTRIVPTPVVQAPSPTSDPTAGWKTYSGELFSFRYPGAWVEDDSVFNNYNKPLSVLGEVTQIRTPIIIINPNTMTKARSDKLVPTQYVSFQSFLSPEKTVKDMVDKIANNQKIPTDDSVCKFDRRKISYSNTSGEAFCVGGEGYWGWYMILSDGKNMVGIKSTIDDPAGDKVENQILKTFTFTASSSGIVSSWKKFSAENYFLKLPSGWTSLKTTGGDIYQLKGTREVSLLITPITGQTEDQLKKYVLGLFSGSPTTKSVTLGKASATEYYGCAGLEGCIVQYILVANDQGNLYKIDFVVSGTMNADDKTLYQNILSTFQFE